MDKGENSAEKTVRFEPSPLQLQYLEWEESWKTIRAQIKSFVLQYTAGINAKKKAEEQLAIYEAWGAYAWTYNGEAPLAFFSEAPASLADADEQMERYCTESNIGGMKDELLAAGLCVSDLEEAYACFTERRYKACVLILFSLLDHELIHKAYRYEAKKGKPGKLKSGLSAILAFSGEKQDAASRYFQERLVFLNIVKAMAALFENHEDFQNEPGFVNRHFVSHGMSKREVTALDCLRVWSALYSFVILLPIIAESDNPETLPGCGKSGRIRRGMSEKMSE